MAQSDFHRLMSLEALRRRQLPHTEHDDIEPVNRHMKRRLKAKAKKRGN